MKFHQPKVLANDKKHLETIIKLVHNLRSSDSKHIALIFCKDIETSIKLYEELKKKYSVEYGKSMQLYTGVGDEEAVIKSAATPGMITVTTSALGRNTDILYPRVHGMTEIQTFPDSIRGTGQKSGRTGRQGSPGDVYHIYSQNDLKDKTLEQIMSEIDAKSAKDRMFNENLYDVIGYLLSIIDRIPPEHFQLSKNEFFRKIWAPFTEEIEYKFRKAKLNDDYSQQEFIEKSLFEFNQRLKDVLYPHINIYVCSNMI